MSTHGKLPANVVNQFPSGRWGFVGRVNAELAYVTNDGQAPSQKQIENAQRFGPGIAGLRPRTWASKSDALDALEAVQS